MNLGKRLAFALSCSVGIVCAQTTDGLRFAGSDTVEPIMEAAAAQFTKSRAGSKVSFDTKGTGQGMTLLCEGRTDFALASRPISGKEVTLCKGKNIAFVELPVAWGGIVVIANRNDGWLRDVKKSELALLWGSDSTQKALKWSDVRSSYPATKVTLIGPDNKSGTRDFFATAVSGGPNLMRADYQQFSEHAAIIDAVAKTPGAIGFVSLTQFADSSAQVAALAVDSGRGPVLPSAQTIISDQYTMLSRLLFVYVNKGSYDQKPMTREFADFFVSGASRFVSYARAIPLMEKNYQDSAAKLKRGDVGSAYSR